MIVPLTKATIKSNPERSRGPPRPSWSERLDDDQATDASGSSVSATTRRLCVCVLHEQPGFDGREVVILAKINVLRGPPTATVSV